VEPAALSDFGPECDELALGGYRDRLTAYALRISVGLVLFVALALAAFPSSAQDATSTTAAPAVPTTAAPVATVAPATSAAPTITAAPSALSAEEQAKKEEATGQLNAAVAEDTAIATALESINSAVHETQAKIDEAQRRLSVAQDVGQTADAELAVSGDQQSKVEVQLVEKAIESFRTGSGDSNPFFGDADVNKSLRQTHLLRQANQSTAELLDQLRLLHDDREAAQAEAASAADAAIQIQEQLQSQLLTLQDQQNEQLVLKGAAESRIDKWESELTAYAAEDAAIKKLIADTQAADVVVQRPTEPSALGFQWPAQGRQSSPYGYRIHPIYGTRKLHTGLDIAAATGTPIATTSGGTVIFSGVRGGYGNTVIVDHGLGITSLYAHMNRIAASDGDAVARGDVIGFVGSTGNSTGPHLHFEIRLDGATTDPRPYLP